MKVFSCVLFDESNLNAARKLGADCVLTCNIKVDDTDKFQIIDANEFRVAGSHYAYLENESLVRTRLAEIWPGVLEYKKVNLITAILKGLYWSNNTRGVLQKAQESLSKEYQRLNRIELHQGNVITALTGWLKLYAASFWRRTLKNKVSALKPECKVVFLVSNLNEFRFIKNLVNQFEREECAIFVPPHNRFRKDELTSLSDEYNVVVFPAQNWLHCPRLKKLPKSKEDAWLIRETARILPEISTAIQWSSELMAGNAEVFVTIAQENTPAGHVLCNFAKAHGKKVVNVMNGIKLGTANDRNAEFSSWFVWDEQMKKLLMEHSQLDPPMLKVLGNLNEDLFSAHENTGSMPLSEKEAGNSFVISIVSTRDLRRDKIVALNYLYHWAAEHRNVVIIYRPHPAEKPDQYYIPDDERVRFHLLTNENQLVKKGLLDQLSISDLVVSFGSTVAMEAAYMGIPSVTFEMKKQSLLYCVDGKNIIHVQSIEHLEGVVNDMMELSEKGKKPAGSKVKKSVAERYANEIKELITQQQ